MPTNADLLVISASALAALVVIAAVFAWSWKGWLELKRCELGGAGRDAPGAGSRIELADLRERVRKLEAIAAGVEM